ncbi:MAG: polysaccharide pyruvyl transferase family protein [Candidatus Rokuibacteriota bacterium]
MSGQGEIEAVAVLSNYGNRNLGDEATLAAILQQVRERCEGARLFAISFDPQDTEVRHGVIALPAQRLPRRVAEGAGGQTSHAVGETSRRVTAGSQRLKARLRAAPVVAPLWRGLRGLWQGVRELAAEALFIARTVKVLRAIDCLVVGGGGQLSDDFGGTWAFPYLVLKWAAMARLAGARVLFVSVGAGPLDSGLARFFVRIALRLGEYRSFRDEGSRALIATLGVAGTVHADPAWVLPVEKAGVGSRPAEAPLVVGINPFPYEDGRYWPGGKRARYEAYLDTLAEFAEWLLERGHSILLFPTQLRSDPRVIVDLKARLSDRLRGLPGRVIERTVETVDDLVATISTVDLVVSGRFHGILLSFLLRKPVVGLSYQSKIDELMRRADQDAYLLSTADLNTRALVERFERLESERAGIEARLAEEARRCRRTLELQFDTLFAPKGSGARPT